jgi:hypothetical protein
MKAVESRHSGQAKRDPESRILKAFWIPAFAGMTEQTTFARGSLLNAIIPVEIITKIK